MIGFTVYVLPKPEPVRVGAVYILMFGNRCTYVGQTTNIDQRMRAHYSRRNRRKESHRINFDRVLWISVAFEDLKAYEGAIARALNPSDTRRVAPDSSRDAEILALLGMQPDETRAFERRVDAAQKKQGRKLKRLIRKYKQRRRDDSAARVSAFIEAAS